MSGAVSYPLAVVYCPNCGMPPEYCEYTPAYEKCKPWIKEHFPHLLPTTESATAPAVSGTTETKKAGSGAAESKPAVSGEIAAKLADIDALSLGSDDDDDDSSDDDSSVDAKPAAKPAKAGAGKVSTKEAIVISRKDRGRGKVVLTITGLDHFEVKLKEASSTIGKKLGVGASVTKGPKGQEITVQGERSDDIQKLLMDTFSIPREAFVFKD